MSQSKRGSFIEAVANVGVGFALALVVQIWVVFPMFDIEVSFAKNVWIVLIFLSVSLFRSYIIRRIGNWIQAWIEWPKIPEDRDWV